MYDLGGCGHLRVSSFAPGGRKGETGGLVAIITMLKEDLEKEISQGQPDEQIASRVFPLSNSSNSEPSLSAESREPSLSPFASERGAAEKGSVVTLHHMIVHYISLYDIILL